MSVSEGRRSRRTALFHAPGRGAQNKNRCVRNRDQREDPAEARSGSDVTGGEGEEHAAGEGDGEEDAEDGAGVGLETVAGDAERCGVDTGEGEAAQDDSEKSENGTGREGGDEGSEGGSGCAQDEHAVGIHAQGDATQRNAREHDGCPIGGEDP